MLRLTDHLLGQIMSCRLVRTASLDIGSCFIPIIWLPSLRCIGCSNCRSETIRALHRVNAAARRIMQKTCSRRSLVRFLFINALRNIVLIAILSNRSVSMDQLVKPLEPDECMQQGALSMATALIVHASIPTEIYDGTRRVEYVLRNNRSTLLSHNLCDLSYNMDVKRRPEADAEPSRRV